MTSDAPLLAIGSTFSKRHAFNEAQVRAFALAAGDTNPLHHDEAVAKASRYGKLIVSGTQSTALLLGLAASHFSRSLSVVGVAFSVEFCKPVFADANVELVWEIVAISNNRGKAQRVDLRGGLYDELGETCVRATGVVSVQST